VAASVPIRAKMGKPLGGVAPLGYQWVEKKLILDPKWAPVRRLIYELFLEHRRKKAVARILTERGYRTRQGKKFTDATLTRILRDPSAKGLYRANYTSTIIKGKTWTYKPESEWIFTNVEPIVPEEMWNECNRILDEQYAKRAPASRPAVYLFSGFVYCSCGQKMPVPSKAKSYKCKKCKNKIGIEDLESVFQEQLKSFLFSPEETTKYFDKTDQLLIEREELMRVLTEEAAKLKEEMNRIVKLYIAHAMSEEAVGVHYRPLEERLKQINNQLPELQGEVDFLRIQQLSQNEVVSEAKDLHSHWNDFTFEDKRRIVETITNKITVSTEEISINLSTIPHPLNSPAFATYPFG
ncbi:MAG: recombinase family protein, partial [Nitrososphaera sp.]|nr:recombinase family protein [Nitrososphaera sp.]